MQTGPKGIDWRDVHARAMRETEHDLPSLSEMAAIAGTQNPAVAYGCKKRGLAYRREECGAPPNEAIRAAYRAAHKAHWSELGRPPTRQEFRERIGRSRNAVYKMDWKLGLQFTPAGDV